MYHVAGTCAGVCNKGKRQADPGGELLIIRILLLLLFTLSSLLSKCCPISTFITLSHFHFGTKVFRTFSHVNEKGCREGEHCHMSLPSAFHLRQTHFWVVSHNHFWSNQHNHVWSSQSHSEPININKITGLSGLAFLDMSFWANPD